MSTTQSLGQAAVGISITVQNTVAGRLLCTKISASRWHIRASAGRKWDAYNMDLATLIGNRTYQTV